ncbi:TetR/AcrR family transcriptional regulator [Nocardioides sp. GY 10113]|uniref:TetR/AcrR family transcriptional regulator n=1 Tax=Nocardioides sp. GY 10113 TaxID=2569761 RepID=UPI0010A83F8A|nr:TetR/AcrR family transcriptional regulator [Nocardioides sp. GY 10113]TIC84805.1 TetR/AcrR family transcriptional regulator [Nocardioides sp. GY 10113]
MPTTEGPAGKATGTTAGEATGSRERILAAATLLFAEHGYEATSTRAIGEAVGLNIATVAYHVGTKPDLYREVMRRAHLAQREVVIGALDELRSAGPTPEETRAALLRFVDAYLDFCLAHPEVPALWMRRWLSDAEVAGEVEAEYAGPLAGEVGAIARDLLDRAGMADDLDVELLVYTIVWTCHSFSRGGVVSAAGQRVSTTDLAMLGRFRRHLHALVTGLIG